MNIQVNELSMYECLMNIMNFMQPGLYLHHLRVAMLADKIAEKINLSEQRREILLYASLIHDLGRVLDIQDQTKPSDISKEAYIHARAGYELLQGDSFFQQIGDIILHHHDWWDGSLPQAESDEVRIVPIESRIICIAEEAAAYLDDPSGNKPLKKLHAYLKTMRLHKLDPDLLTAFDEISFLDIFWQEFTWPQLKVYFHQYTEDRYFKNLSLKNFKGFAEVLFALLVHWNMASAKHSRLVANVTATIAKLKGYDEDVVKCLYICGLLHDLGKIAISKELLAKAGDLTTEEYKIASKHAYYTYWLLDQINGLEDIAKGAGYHHEFLDGTGYPFGLDAKKIPEEARIVTVANILVNLSEDKKTHSLVPLGKVKCAMQKLVKAGKLDQSIVEIIFNNGECFREDKVAVNS